MEVTLQDIARELDVSAATVSRSLRHDTLINPETRARVNEAAVRMGYVSRARRPRRVVENEADSRTIGLLLHHNTRREARNDINLMYMMSGVMAVTDANRVLLQMHTIQHEGQRYMAEDPSAVPPIAQKGVCQAYIVHGAQDERDIEFLAELAPVISMGRHYRKLPIDAVVGDNIEGVRTMVAHLAELGHQRLAWVGSGVAASFMEARQAGFIQGCIERQLAFDPRFLLGPDVYEEKHIHAENGVIWALGAGITGFVCGNDYVARQMIKVLNLVGKSVPTDVSVIAFDALSNTREISLTGIDPHFYDIGQAAAQLAIQRITHTSSQPCIINVRGELVEGGTTAPAP